MDITVIGTGNLARGVARHALECVGHLHMVVHESVGTGFASAVKGLG